MISIVIPIYNEEDNIEKLSESIIEAMLNINYEVLFINDGSTDNSAHTIEKIIKIHANFKLINLRRNYGQTAAMQAGFDNAQGEVVIPMDGDLQNDPKDIPKLIEKLDEGYDVVSGWRKERLDKKFTRILPSKIANSLISKISGIHLHDYGCTLKAYRKEILNDIKLYGEMHRFIPIYASWEGARVTEIPVMHHARNAGVTKYGLSRIPKVILDLLVIRFFDKSLDRPIHFCCFYIGVICYIYKAIYEYFFYFNPVTITSSFFFDDWINMHFIRFGCRNTISYIF